MESGDFSTSSPIIQIYLEPYLGDKERLHRGAVIETLKMGNILPGDVAITQLVGAKSRPNA